MKIERSQQLPQSQRRGTFSQSSSNCEKGEPFRDSTGEEANIKVMAEAISSQLLNVDGIGLTAYEKFLEERFCTKTVCLSDTIHRTNVKTPLLQFTSLVIQRMFLKRYQSAKMPSYNECLILQRSEESPWKNFSSLMYVLVLSLIHI